MQCNIFSCKRSPTYGNVGKARETAVPEDELAVLAAREDARVAVRVLVEREREQAALVRAHRRRRDLELSARPQEERAARVASYEVAALRVRRAQHALGLLLLLHTRRANRCLNLERARNGGNSGRNQCMT